VSPLAATRGLRYATDREPGLSRHAQGDGFAYRTAQGKGVKDERTLERIRSLAIPPAWTRVWICRDAAGHLQAVGYDARGRKQYRYHPMWRAEREASKYDHLETFGRLLPAIRKRVASDLRLPGLPREKVIATLVRLLDRTALRVGNERYARDNGSYGLTTLRGRHVKVSGSRVAFSFTGKGGKAQAVSLDDPRLAKLVRRLRDLPGQELFQYVDDTGAVRDVGSSDVNAYLQEISGDDEVSAKDFRTWTASVLVANMLAGSERPQTRVAMKEAIEIAAKSLGNTPAICRKSYVHPSVMDTRLWLEALRSRRKPRRHPGLRQDEGLLMSVLGLERGAREKPLADVLKASLRAAARKKAGAPSAAAC